MDAVEDELALLEVGDLRVLVVAPNAEAIRFYERRGLVKVTQVRWSASHGDGRPDAAFRHPLLTSRSDTVRAGSAFKSMTASGASAPATSA
jgi:hypothetical protein